MMEKSYRNVLVLSGCQATLRMKPMGRRGGFQLGTAIGSCGGGLSSPALWVGNFWLMWERRAARQRR
jgi:hypothetical protein